MLAYCVGVACGVMLIALSGGTRAVYDGGACAQCVRDRLMGAWAYRAHFHRNRCYVTRAPSDQCALEWRRDARAWMRKHNLDYSDLDRPALTATAANGTNRAAASVTALARPASTAGVERAPPSMIATLSNASVKPATTTTTTTSAKATQAKPSTTSTAAASAQRDARRDHEVL
jgi:hypothetical protein